MAFSWTGLPNSAIASRAQILTVICVIKLWLLIPDCNALYGGIAGEDLERTSNEAIVV
jgi:hypothetical protein